MKNFSDFTISEPVMKAITDLGFTTPSPIQVETLPLLLGNSTDFLGLAATGTGKTAAFGIPLLERIDKKTRGVQGLILCPTRELAMQVAGQIDLLGKYLGIRALPVYGGTGYGDQIYGLKAGATIVVGTPGRVVDHIDKGTLKLDGLNTLILDEADEMISMGFKEDLEKVLKSVPENQANIWLFSATMGGEVAHVANEYLKSPKKVQINRTEMVPTTVEQVYYLVHEYDKPEVVCKLIDAADDFYGIIFCQTKALVSDLTQFLSSRGYRADCLHGDMDQSARDRVMKSFREKNLAILIATDVACRGLDVKDISHVINYSIPRELDNYVHRIGRTGRSGKSGLALSLVTNSHRQLIGRIENMTRSRIKEGKVPGPKEVALKKVSKALAAFAGIGPQGRLGELLGDDWTTAVAELTKEQIVARFIAIQHPELANGGQPVEGMKDSRPAATEVRAERSDSRGASRGGASRDREGGGRRDRDSGGGYKPRRFEGASRPERRNYDRPDRPERSEAPRRFEGAPRQERSYDKPKFEARREEPARRYRQGSENKFEARKPVDERKTAPWERREPRSDRAKGEWKPKRDFSSSADRAGGGAVKRPFKKDFSKAPGRSFSKNPRPF